MTKRLVLLSLLSCLLAACGNKGPLVLPESPASATAPAAETPAAPAVEPPAGGDAGTPAARS
jgi:predicted small lipoprotein YifL